MSDTKHPSATVTEGIAERYDNAKIEDGFGWATTVAQHGFTWFFRMSTYDFAMTEDEKEKIRDAIIRATTEMAEARGYEKPPKLKRGDYQRNVVMDLSDNPSENQGAGEPAEGLPVSEGA